MPIDTYTAYLHQARRDQKQAEREGCAMIFACPQCHVKNDVSDLSEIHDGLRLCCLACDHVTVVKFDAPQPPPGERGAKEA